MDKQPEAMNRSSPLNRVATRSIIPLQMYIISVMLLIQLISLRDFGHEHIHGQTTPRLCSLQLFQSLFHLSNTSVVDVYRPCTAFDTVAVLVNRFKRERASTCWCVYLSLSHHNKTLNLDCRSSPRQTVIEAQSVFATRPRPDCS